MGMPALGQFDEEDLRCVVRWTEVPTNPIQESTLSSKENALLDLLRERRDERLTASDVMGLSPFLPEETLRTLGSLISSGVVELADPSHFIAEELAATRGIADVLPLPLPPPPAAPIPSPSPSPSPPASAGPPGPYPDKLGRFEIVQLLGRGSMGAVLLAQDPAIGRVVAIKLVQSASHLMPAQRERYHDRFYREASAAGRLNYPGIAAVYDVGHMEDGTPFIVMEYLAGRTLREVLENETLTVEQTLRIAKDLVGALDYAHTEGVVHRDVKPSNIIITEDFHARIMDFGIAHVVGSELTAGDEVLGSPSYMAPEQLSKGKIDQTTDVFAFGVVLYRMLAGTLPFVGDSFAAVALAILNETPARPSDVVPSVPEGLSRIIMRCLAKPPEDRYPSAEAVRRALVAFENGESDENGEIEDGKAASASAAEAEQDDRWLTVSVSLILGGFLVWQLLGAMRDIGSADDGPTPGSGAHDFSERAGAGMGPDGAPTPVLDLERDGELETAPAEPESPSAPAPGSESSRNRGTAGAARAPAPTPAPRVTKRTAEPAQDAATSANGDGDVDDTDLEVDAHAETGGVESSPAELFYDARLAIDRGELEQARELLGRLLEHDPTFSGAEDLHLSVTDQIWERELPLAYVSRHDHRLGSCVGEISLASIGIRFVSDKHEWAFRAEDIRVLERPSEQELIVETFDKNVLSLGLNKRYRFELAKPLSDDDWTRYQRLIH